MQSNEYDKGGGVEIEAGLFGVNLNINAKYQVRYYYYYINSSLVKLMMSRLHSEYIFGVQYRFL